MAKAGALVNGHFHVMVPFGFDYGWPQARKDLKGFRAWGSDQAGPGRSLAIVDCSDFCLAKVSLKEASENVHAALLDTLLRELLASQAAIYSSRSEERLACLLSTEWTCRPLGLSRRAPPSPSGTASARSAATLRPARPGCSSTCGRSRRPFMSSDKRFLLVGPPEELLFWSAPNEIVVPGSAEDLW